MSLDENKAIVRRFEESANTGDLDSWDEICVPDLVAHAGPGSELDSLAAYKEAVSANRIRYPDMHVVIEEMIAEGDRVVARATFRGTLKGEVFELQPTGLEGATTGFIAYRLVDGRIAEIWEAWNTLGLFFQLGFKLVPSED